ncbi:hypothetical protein [Novosphingobium aquae]|uniref:Uncharacterized protein n=1 Tax=Novosphingobium aquae TaxID=3133435 RepID=A0ABU8SB70_9SPHN
MVIEPFPVNGCELPHEWHDRTIRHCANRSAKLACSGEADIPLLQELHTHRAMLERIDAVTLGIFIPVEVMLERTIVLGDRCRIIAWPASFRGPASRAPSA